MRRPPLQCQDKGGERPLFEAHCQGNLIREENQDLVAAEDLDVLGPGSIPESPSVNTDGLILDSRGSVTGKISRNQSNSPLLHCHS